MIRVTGGCDEGHPLLLSGLASPSLNGRRRPSPDGLGGMSLDGRFHQTWDTLEQIVSVNVDDSTFSGDRPTWVLLQNARKTPARHGIQLESWPARSQVGARVEGEKVNHCGTRYAIGGVNRRQRRGLYSVRFAVACRMAPFHLDARSRRSTKYRPRLLATVCVRWINARGQMVGEYTDVAGKSMPLS